MFKKLLSNLPYNPSLIGKVNFYAGRLRAESSVRKLGVVFLVLALGVQIFAVAIPSEPTLAASNNDIVYGGAKDKGDMVNKCNSNQQSFKTILAHFGIDCLRIYAGTDTTINSKSYNGKLRSLGRIAYGFAGETPVSIAGTTYFMRPLSAWDSSGSGSNYKVLRGKALDGSTFFIMYDCANIVIIAEPPTPPPTPPAKGVKCSNLFMNVKDNAKVAVGETISVRGQAVGKNLNPGELAGMFYEFVDAKSNKVIEEKKGIGVPFKNGTAEDSTPRSFKIPAAGNYIIRLTVRYESGKKIATGSNTGNCKKKVRATTDTPPPPPPPPPPPVIVSGNPNIEQHKKVKNDTQNIPDAANSTVNPGDELTYTLSVTNTSNDTAAEDYVIEENIGDILDYADVSNLHGGSIDSNNTVKWPATTIAPGVKIERQITVKVKAVIPDTPSPGSNPGSFDCKMTNVFGDTVEVNIPCSPAKTAEQITGTLPNTGPGAILAVAFTVTTVAGYFLARSRLMAKELDIVRTDYATSGGN